MVPAAKKKLGGDCLGISPVGVNECLKQTVDRARPGHTQYVEYIKAWNVILLVDQG